MCDAAGVSQLQQAQLANMGAMAQPDAVLTRLEERFEKLRSTLVADHPGQWALLIDRGSRLVPLLQVLDDEWDAIRAGYADPAVRRFCVKPILEADPELMVNSLGARH